METKHTLSSCSNSEAQQMQQIQDKAKKSCMVSFRKLHSHLKRLSRNDLQGTRTESGFKRAFTTLFGQDIETFTGTMFLNVEQLKKQLDKEDFQEIGSMAAFNYTRLAILEFCDTLIQHMESVKKSIDERAQHKREYDSWVNERQKAVGQIQKSRIQAVDQGMMHMMMMQITDPYMMKSQWLRREAASAKPHHMIASSNSRISSENMPRISSNDMVHNHYLEEAKKKTEERCRNSEPSLMPPTRSQSTVNGSKPKPRINNQNSTNWLASKNSFVMTKNVPIAEHSRNSRNFSDSKHFICSTCQKCVFNANDDSCVTKFLKEVNSRAKVPSNKTTNRNKPVEQISVPNKQERHIPIGHRFSIKKTFFVQEKTMTLRSCLSWKLTGRIFKTVHLRWVPTGKIFTSSTTKVDSDPPNSSIADITNQYECEQTLDVSAGTLNLSACKSFNPKKKGLRVWLLKRPISPKPWL
nr:hypothetical protein [Tanacetum cinerariifolium]